LSRNGTGDHHRTILPGERPVGHGRGFLRREGQERVGGRQCTQRRDLGTRAQATASGGQASRKVSGGDVLGMKDHGKGKEKEDMTEGEKREGIQRDWGKRGVLAKLGGGRSPGAWEKPATTEKFDMVLKFPSTREEGLKGSDRVGVPHQGSFLSFAGGSGSRKPRPVFRSVSI